MSSSSGAQLACSSCGSALRPGDYACVNCGAPVTGHGGAFGTPQSVPQIPTSFSWDTVIGRLKQLTMGEYEILVELGRGGMAAVHLAHEYSLNRKVALKVMSPAIMMGDGMIERFHQEAVTQANLSHPNIVGVHGVRQKEDLHFFVMQYIPGRSLQQVIKASRAESRLLPIGVVRALLYQIGSAVSFAHRRGVIHRDIKPANILINGDGDAVVTDFGIAKVAEMPSQTLTGTVVGTPPYMSPEQCYAAELTGASDQYSLGIVAYEMLTGRAPFTGSSFAVMQAHTMQAPAPIRDARPDCPEELESAVLRMLAKHREERFPNVRAALTALGAHPISTSDEDPVRHTLVALADVAGVEKRLGDVVRMPMSPSPLTRPMVTARPTTNDLTNTVQLQTAERAFRPDQVVQLRLADPPARVEVGETLQLSVTALSGAGSEIASPKVRWSTSNAQVARVAPDTGLVEARSSGSADIVVASGDAVATARITVRDAAVADIVLEGFPSSLEVGDSTPVEGFARDKRGIRLHKQIKWSVRDSAYATLSASGETLSGRAAGSTAVIGVVDGVRGEWSVQVLAPRPVRIEIGGVPDLLGIGEVSTVSATIFDKRGLPIAGMKPQWSAGDGDVVQLSGEGSMRGVSQGRTTIEVKCDTAAATASVSVGVIPIAKLIVDGVPDKALVGAKRRLSVRAIDSTGRVRVLPIEWSSSQPDVAAVDSDSQLVVKAAGDTVLRVRCGTNERSFPLEVERVVPMSERVREVSMRVRAVGAGFPRLALQGAGALSLIGLLAFAASKLRDSAPNTTGEVSQPPIPPIDSAALVGAVAEGEEPATKDSATNLNAVSTGDSPKTSDVRKPNGGVGDTVPKAADPVSSPAAMRVQIVRPARPSIESGETMQLSANTIPQSAGKVASITWRSRDPLILDVGRTSGVVTAKSPGISTVEARVDSVTTTIRLTVTVPSLDLLEIRGERSLVEGDSISLSVIGRSARGDVLVVEGPSWTSSRTNVAAVDPRGTVRGLSAGTSTISVESNGKTTGVGILVSERPKPPPVVVPKAPEQPPKPTVPQPTSEMAALEADQVCRAAYTSGNQSRIEPLGRNGTTREQTNQQKLLDIFKKQTSVTVVASGGMGQPELEGGVARVEFAVVVGWRDFVRKLHRETITVLATLRQSGSAWTVESCRIKGTPNLQ
ncbi:MAG: protein kinase [Gemmatimonadaceae bacterium]|nr:protein kinase [Gemmatimonadaceae bacterium]